MRYYITEMIVADTNVILSGCRSRNRASFVCALAGNAQTIVTSDRHFGHPAVTAFGLTVMTAGDFVAKMNRERNPK